MKVLKDEKTRRIVKVLVLFMIFVTISNHATAQNYDWIQAYSVACIGTITFRFIINDLEEEFFKR